MPKRIWIVSCYLDYDEFTYDIWFEDLEQAKKFTEEKAQEEFSDIPSESWEWRNLCKGTETVSESHRYENNFDGLRDYTVYGITIYR